MHHQGKRYGVVELDGHCWMAEDLASHQFLNGDSIPMGLLLLQFCCFCRRNTVRLPERMEARRSELSAFRDLIFLFKLFMCPEQDMLPARGRWRHVRACWR